MTRLLFSLYVQTKFSSNHSATVQLVLCNFFSVHIFYIRLYWISVHVFLFSVECLSLDLCYTKAFCDNFMAKNSATFFDFRISQGSVATYCRWGGNLCGFVHREFCCESVGKRILKIGPHLPKLLSNIKGYTFLKYTVHVLLTLLSILSLHDLLHSINLVLFGRFW